MKIIYFKNISILGMSTELITSMNSHVNDRERTIKTTLSIKNASFWEHRAAFTASISTHHNFSHAGLHLFLSWPLAYNTEKASLHENIYNNSTI